MCAPRRYPRASKVSRRARKSSSASLPDGVGPQALSLKLIDPPPTLTRPRREAPAEHKHSPDELHGMVEDMITLLEGTVQPELRKGRYPDRKIARKVSDVVKAVARELDA